MLRQIAIIGAGLAGTKAAESLRQQGFDGRLWLIGDEHSQPYQRPPLSKECLLEDEILFDRVAIHEESFYGANNIDLLVGSRVDSIDPRARTLSLGTKTLTDIDAFILCTGGGARRLDWAADNDGILYLRTIGDAQAIAARLSPGIRLAVIGGGMIGCEVAASASKRGASVTIIEAGPALMWRSLGTAVAAQLELLHRDNHVDVHTDMIVTGHKKIGSCHILHFANGMTLEADLIVAGLGLSPYVKLAQDAGIEVSDGIHVNADLRTSVPHVLAAGDIAAYPSAFLSRRVRQETVHNASDHGERAARTLLGIEHPEEEIPWGWSDQYGLNLQMAGEINSSVPPIFRGDRESGSFCALYLQGGVLRGAVGFDRPGEMSVMRRLIKQRRAIPADRLCDETAPARMLLNVA